MFEWNRENGYEAEIEVEIPEEVKGLTHFLIAVPTNEALQADDILKISIETRIYMSDVEEIWKDTMAEPRPKRVIALTASTSSQ